MAYICVFDTELWSPYGWSLYQQSTIGNETHGVMWLQFQDIFCTSEELPVSSHFKLLGTVQSIYCWKILKKWQMCSGVGMGGLIQWGTMPIWCLYHVLQHYSLNYFR